MRFLGWSCALVLAGGLSAHALSVSPTRIVVNDDGGTQVAVRLAGESGPIPLEVTIVERFPGGAFAAVPESVIRAHPPQLLLDTDKPRNVQIEISGGIAEEIGRSFYLRVEQLGLRSVHGGAEDDREIMLLATYLLPVHVLGGHAEKLIAELVLAPEGAQVVFTNAGQGPALLSNCSVTFTAQTGADVEIDGRRLAEQIGSDAILPSETIRFDLMSLLSNSKSQSEAAVIRVRTACDRSS